MSGYLALKHVHVTAVVLSGSLFMLRGLLMLADSPRLGDRWARIAPHVIDTVLLASAIGLAVWSGQIPFVQPWLGAKLVALLLYIVLGSLALKRAPSKRARSVCLLLALLTFAYIVSVAITRQVLPWQA
jgi:uncharacterized membrane protein SirB2